MNDDALRDAWSTLEPTAFERRRMEARVDAWLDAHDTSLLSEWISLFRLQPLSAAGLVTASAVSLATAPPMLWFVRTLL